MSNRAEWRAKVNAALFDMDGVVADTAQAHAAAWKRLFDGFLEARAEQRGEAFEPFDVGDDYRRHVDGRPRAEGIRSFLDSRGIELPAGTDNDGPDAETVAGLGKRKNQYFHAWLDENRVRPCPGTLRLLDALRSAGVPAALFSSSRNAEAVLSSAGLGGYFVVKVDGNDLLRLGIPGKPDPAMLLEAARRLGVRPEACAVFEDAGIGVEAGVRGGFWPVIGVSRDDHAEQLLQAGAERVVRDLGELRYSGAEGLQLRTLETLPCALDHENELLDRLKTGRPAVFLDYDGTLTPIVDDHTRAFLAEDMRATVASLARHCPVVIVSGRDLGKLRELVALECVWLAGSHGFEIAGPRGVSPGLEQGREFLPELDAAEQALEERLAYIDGHSLERKRFSIAVHYRGVASADVDRLASAVREVLEKHPKLRLGRGKKVLDIGPDIHWNKGEAVRWVLSELDGQGAEIVPVYVGDDLTDEDAFRTLAGQGICVAVRHDESRPTAADYAVGDVRGVKRLLQSLTGFQAAQAPGAATMRELKKGEWSLRYSGYRPQQEGLREALCTLGNGYCATRGAAAYAQADDVHYPGTYLAGGYNRLASDVAGRRIENEDLVNLPNWLPLTFRVGDGNWFRFDDTEILSVEQELDVVRGLLLRNLRFRDAQGRMTVWRECRLVSMASPHIAALCVEVTAEDWSGPITVRSSLDGGVVNDGVARYRGLGNRHLEIIEADHRGENTVFLRTRTSQSLLGLAQAACTRIYRDGFEIDAERCTLTDDRGVAQEIVLDLPERATIRVEKIAALYSSRDWAISEPGIEALRALGRAGRFDAIRTRHEMAWRHLWSECDITLDDDGAPATELKLRVHIFHLLQTASKHSVDLDAGVPARGWTGEAYRGHIFWDELFIFPFLNLRIPMLTRALLRYRHRRLGEARQAATEAGYRGAMFPWQSGSDGREETQRLHLNPASGRWLPDISHRQRHISSAIAYNVWQYFQASDDHEFMNFYGAEMLLEIARFWASASVYNSALDRYEIKGVMGPDEYHTAYPDADPEAEGGVDNNAYTNVMAAWVLTRARDAIDVLPEMRWRELRERMGLDDEELEHWDEISRKLRVPMHQNGIISQFEGYEDLEEFDWDGYRERYGDIQRLDRILEAEGDSPNRYKLSKQADVLMLFYLFSAEELALLFEQLGYPFDPETIPRNVQYYLARTSHGSTLSQLVHSWVMARSDRSHSWNLFQRVLDSDIADIQGGTTPEGIHVGAMAGSVDLVQRCYLGIGLRGNVLHFDPAFPPELRCVKLRLHYRNQTLEVEADHDRLEIRSGAYTTRSITVAYRGHYRELAPGDRCGFRLLKPDERVRDENRLGTGEPHAAC
ncbi:Trehalose-6-phosphate phosphatase [Thioalkalivibrio nitratireducens DSM 14787]|uniref:Trehalose-6-phosphate phosphatase n=1 Tax=Thioalkalivibrio nitratireducens (strain DSM 14787 / UNIQEM 213 / ALEN2) TaxID=1255043 RepID=L0DUV4_THIND|nr:trehalose-phosphatase [Thioalkalivibrio nitratireducens]AGA32775.1 Trehalose-6-phosphate phosphatase [Thioalkalivibrio nitratireducens DSM 14787]